MSLEDPSQPDDSQMKLAQHSGLLDRWASPFISMGRSIGELAPVSMPLGLLRRSFPAFKIRDFRLIWSGALVSNIGLWMQNVARDWLVYQLSGETGKFWLGLNGFVEGLAVVAMLPLGGALADRIDRRKLLIISNSYQAVLAVILAILAATGRLQAWHVVLMTGLNGLGESLRIPAQQSMFSTLVPREHMVNALALGAMQFNLSRALGPALAGVVLYKLGAAWGFGINALSYLAVIWATCLLQSLPARKATIEPIITSLKLGFDYVRRRKDIVLMLITVFATGFLISPTLKLLPAIAGEMLDGDASTFAHLLTWFGLGAMGGAIVLASQSKKGPKPNRAWPLIILMGVGECLMPMLGQWPGTKAQPSSP
ncbi:MAG: MFS transporter [Phycisphaerales bacterium]|nr:MFS transporter [Phycisphaerales bacterium]